MLLYLIEDYFVAIIVDIGFNQAFYPFHFLFPMLLCRMITLSRDWQIVSLTEFAAI
jgi:hypothetical protein